LLAGMQVPWSTFRIMLRQQVIRYFADSQSLGQAICPTTSMLGFQSFLCGSNCCAVDPGVILQLPLVINENLRMLMRTNFHYFTVNRNLTRNRIIHMPVWGAFKGTVPINVSVEFGETIYPMFLEEPTSPAPPSIWDGSWGNLVADFNATLAVQTVQNTWNFFMDDVKAFIFGSTALGGSKEYGSLLQFTRYVEFSVPQEVEIRTRRVHNRYRQYIVEKEYDEIVPSTLERSKSKKDILVKKIKKRFF